VSTISGVFRWFCATPHPLERTAVIFVAILGLFLAPFRNKISATCDQMRFWPKNAPKCVCGPLGELTALYNADNLFTVDSRRVVPLLSYLHQ